RRERAGRHTKKPRHANLRLQHYREPAIVRCGRLRGHPRDDLALQHHVQITQLLFVSGEPEQERRADVVRQIADDAQSRTQRRIVESQRIGDVQRELVAGKVGGEARSEIAVDLDVVDRSGTLDQRAGKSGQPRADLDQVVAWMRIDGVDDLRDVMSIGEKILPKTFSCDVTAHRDRQPPRCATSSSARSMAAYRLPGSAARALAPSAARSSAVPWSTDVRTKG